MVPPVKFALPVTVTAAPESVNEPPLTDNEPVLNVAWLFASVRPPLLIVVAPVTVIARAVLVEAGCVVTFAN
jgi:hypothetical protein